MLGQPQFKKKKKKKRHFTSHCFSKSIFCFKRLQKMSSSLFCDDSFLFFFVSASFSQKRGVVMWFEIKWQRSYHLQSKTVKIKSSKGNLMSY